MIRVSHPHIESKIYLDPAFPMILVSESPLQYYKFIMQLLGAFNGEESEFSFWIEENKLNVAEKGEMISDFYTFSLSDKKTTSLLYKRLLNNFNNDYFLLEFNTLSAQFDKFLYDLSDSIDFSLEHEELCLESLLKATALKPAKDYNNILEKLVSFVNLFVELKNIDFFIFVGLKEILDDNDLELFYHHCELKNVSLLIMEGYKSRPLLKNEKCVIITEDLCEIVENFE